MTCAHKFLILAKSQVIAHVLLYLDLRFSILLRTELGHQLQKIFLKWENYYQLRIIFSKCWYLDWLFFMNLFFRRPVPFLKCYLTTAQDWFIVLKIEGKWKLRLSIVSFLQSSSPNPYNVNPCLAQIHNFVPKLITIPPNM